MLCVELGQKGETEGITHQESLNVSPEVHYIFKCVCLLSGKVLPVETTKTAPHPPMEACRITVLRGNRLAVFLSHPAESIILVFWFHETTFLLPPIISDFHLSQIILTLNT